MREVNASSAGTGAIGAEAADKRYFGRPIPAIKVTLHSPEMMAKAVKQLGKIPGVEAILEDDLRYTTAYLLDSGMVPCRWHEAEAEEIKAPAGVDVNKVYRLRGFPVVIEKIEPAPLRILCFSMICYSPIGTANPEINPVIILTTASNKGECKQFVAKESAAGIDDRSVIEGLSRIISDFSPDIIIGFGSNVRDIPYLKKILFTGAKKRYAGLLPNGDMDIVGLEVVRGDWAYIAREVQERVIEKVLKEESPEKGVAYVKSRISDLNSGQVLLRDLVIWKTLTKPVEEYEANTPHVEAAKKLLEKGFRLSLGDKVGYVIVKGMGKLYQRATPYAMATLPEIDKEYYVTNQILPAALRILEGFGIGEEDLKF